MATLVDIEGRRIPLRVNTLVGRWPTNDLILDDATVSGLHAAIAWGNGRWMIRDLGSRNGTTVDGSPVDGTVLRAGMRVSFGKQPFEVADVAPPTAFAIRERDGTMVAARDGWLAIPDAGDPVASVMRDGDSWLLEEVGGARELHDREVVYAGEDAWRIHLPLGAVGGEETLAAALDLAQVTLHLSVSLDHESVGAVVKAGSFEVDLGERAHHELLLLLARSRREDADLADAEQGWRYHDDVCRDLKWTDNQLYLAVHRARKQLEEAGVGHAARLVERRRRTGQLRIGLALHAIREDVGGV